MTKRQIFAGTMAAILVTGIAVVDAQGRRGPAGLLGPRAGIQGQMLGGGPIASLARLGLTDDQQAKLKTILSDAQAERLAARTKTHDAIFSILTPEQKAKLGRK